MNLVCPHCESVNRVPPEKPALAAKCGRCHQQLFDGRPVAVSDAALRKHIARNDIPVAVDFWAEWCGPCRAMAPAYAQAAQSLEPAIRFLKLDTEAEPATAGRYGIQGIPTLILFRHGQPVARQVGAFGQRALFDWLRQGIGRETAA